MFIPLTEVGYLWQMDKELNESWKKIEEMVETRFGEKLDTQTILFVIGLQELGFGMQTYKKEEKLDIIHIGVCTVLTPLGYYQYIGKDDEDWPHYKNIKKLPHSLTGELQEILLKEAIIAYFTTTTE